VLNSKSKIKEEAHFQIQRCLHENPNLSQRKLGKCVGIRLGAVDYGLNGLIKRGFVKALSFKRSSNKSAYAYLSIPVGIAEKALPNPKFIGRKIMEYDALN
jgi:EPS-associated MarR family transcriptional regulator